MSGLLECAVRMPDLVFYNLVQIPGSETRLRGGAWNNPSKVFARRIQCAYDTKILQAIILSLRSTYIVHRVAQQQHSILYTILFSSVFLIMYTLYSSIFLIMYTVQYYLFYHVHCKVVPFLSCTLYSSIFLFLNTVQQQLSYPVHFTVVVFFIQYTVQQYLYYHVHFTVVPFCSCTLYSSIFLILYTVQQYLYYPVNFTVVPFCS